MPIRVERGSGARRTHHNEVRVGGFVLLLTLSVVLPACSTSSVETTAPATTASIAKPKALPVASQVNGPDAKTVDAAACRQGTEAMTVEITRLNGLPVAMRDESEQAPSTLSALFQRSSEPLRGLPAHKAYTSGRAQLEEQNKQLAATGCPTIDLNERLAASDAAIASGKWRFGTEAEAKSMLAVAFSDLAADRDLALRRMLAGWAPFKSRDIRVACAERGTGLIVTSGNGNQRLADLQDASRSNYGAAIQKAANGATPAAPKEVLYTVTPPAGAALASRVAFVAQNDSLMCWTSAYR